MLCLAGLLLAASAWMPLVLLGGFVVGLGYGPATPASSVILVRTAPREIFSLVFSIKQTGVPAGGVLAGLVVPVLRDVDGLSFADIEKAIAEFGQRHAGGGVQSLDRGQLGAARRAGGGRWRRERTARGQKLVARRRHRRARQL